MLRSGIATGEQIITGVQEGFGMERDLGASITGFNIVYINSALETYTELILRTALSR